MDSVEDKAKYAAVTKLTPLREHDAPFTPCFLFFYGSLMDSDVLQAILELPTVPLTHKAFLEGFTIKMWGIYPAIIQGGGEKILGTVWKVDSETHFLRLAEYETSNYTWCPCNVELENGEVLSGCRTFCWAGDPKSKDLADGSFDLERYQKYFKQSVVRNSPK